MKINYPDIIQISDEYYKLDTDYQTQLPNGDHIIIKKGFVYDGQSIPRLFWSLIGSPFTGSSSRAGFIHDALYASESYTRAECDWLFLLIMKACGTGWIKRNLMWSSVKVGGSFVWSNHIKEEVQKAKKLITIIK